MKIIDEFSCGSVSGEVRYRQINADGKNEDGNATLLKEHVLTVVVNNEREREIVCTATDLPELVLGRLLTDGEISSEKDVRTLMLSKDGRHCEITVCKNGSAPSGEGSCAVSDESIFALADYIKKSMPLYALTKSAHSCLLLHNGEIKAVSEDMSRHNAFDKVIGAALRAGLPLAECAVYTSGRVPLDMVKKAAAAKVSVIISKASPTLDAVQNARESGIKLICSAYPDSFKVFS